MRRVVDGVAGALIGTGLAALVLAGCAASSLRPFGWGGEDDAIAAAGEGPVATPAPAPAASAQPPDVLATPVASLAAASRIVGLAVEPEGDGTRVVIELDGFVEPQVSLLANERLVLDLAGASCAAVPRTVEADDALVARLRTGQQESGSRVVVDLRRRADFVVRAEPRRIVIGLAAPDGAASPLEVARLAPAGSGILLPPEGTPAPPLPTAEPTAEPTASPDATAAPEPSPSPTSTTPPEVLATPEPQATLEPPPAPEPSPTPAAAPLPDAGRRVSVDFEEAGVRTVIALIARAGGYQVIFTPDVAGTVTLSVVDRPWEDALETVLRAKRLREVRHEDVMLVSPAGR